MRISDWSSDVCSSDLIERARRLLNDRFRMAAQIGNDRIGPFGSNVLGESLWSHAGQRCQIRKPLAKSGIGFPQAFPFLHGGVGKGEMPGIEGKRPTIVARQRRETLHRGAVDALIYHLIERKGAALASAINVGESNRRGSEFGGIRTVTVAGSAMAARTILDEKGLPTGKIGHSGWSERDRIGFEQIRSEEHTSELQSLMRI